MYNKQHYIKLLHNFALTTLEIPNTYIYDDDIMQTIYKNKWYILNNMQSDWIILVRYNSVYD